MTRRTNGALGRLVHYASFAFSLLAAGIRGPKPDAILAFSSTPLFGGIASLALARLRRVPLVYVVQDVHPDIALALGLLSPGIASRFAGLLERATWRGATRLVLIGRDLEEVARTRGVDPARIAIVANWADLARIRPISGSAIRRAANLEEDAFVVQYAGNFGRSQDLDSVLEAARRVERELSREKAATRPVRFLFVGGGARAAEIRTRAESLSNVRVLGFQPAERVSEVLAAADVSLVPLQAGLSRFSVPSKVYSILASGRAVGAAVDAGSEVARLIDEADCGFRIDPGDPDALAREILRLARDPERAAFLGANGRRWAEERGGLDRAAESYEAVLTQAAQCR